MSNKSKSKSGNYLAGNSPHKKRNHNDNYATPYHCTWLLLANESFSGHILEPACGDGAIVRVLNERGFDVTYSDIATGYDFLERPSGAGFDNIITNPPYRHALAFIKKAKEVAAHKIAFLLPLNYLQGKERYEEIYKDMKFPLKKVMPFTRYLLLTDKVRPDGKCGYGMVAFAWYIFDKDAFPSPYPIIHWLDNDAFIARGSVK